MPETKPSKLWNRDFAILLAGLVQSYFGDIFLAIGLMWLVLEMTGSPLIGGTILALEAAPKLLGPLAGVIVDRTSKRKLMIYSDLLRGLILLAIFGLHMMGLLEIWHLYVLVVFLGLLSIFYDPALRVLLPSLVPDSTLPVANSTLQAAQQIAMTVGASAAGIALTAFGTQTALFLDGISFIVAGLVIGLVRFPPSLLETARLSASQAFSDLKEGFRYIVTVREVLTLAILAFCINLILSPVNVVFPILSRDVLGEGVTGFGFLSSAITIGLLLGSVTAGIIGDRLPYKQAILMGLIGITIMTAALSLVQSLWPALIFSAGLGMMAPIIQIPSLSRLQRLVPKNYQGRVFATLVTLVTLAVPLATTMAGRALTTTSVTVVVRTAAVGILAVTIFWFVLGLRWQRPSAVAQPILAELRESEAVEYNTD